MLFEAPLKIYWRIVIVLLWWTSAASQQHPFLGEIWVKVELLSLNLPSLQIFLSEPLSNITFLSLAHRALLLRCLKQYIDACHAGLCADMAKTHIF